MFKTKKILEKNDELNRANHILQTVIDELIDEKNRKQKELDIARHNNVILLQNSVELRNKIKDLENNLELLANNSKNKKIKELRSE